MRAKIDLRKKASENAQDYYSLSKKYRSKIKGARNALEKTEEAIAKLKQKKEVEEATPLEVKKKRERRWYHVFRWFNSSDGLLVVGGRDATSNEVLIKKHVEANDIIFHAELKGAPFFVIKNTRDDVPESTLLETALAAASYSKAWRQGFGAVDVYWVKPEQVTKEAPSGEYLPKGGFMIRGRKNYFRNTVLRVAVGFVAGDEVEVIGGPLESVKKYAKFFVTLGTGELKQGEVAKKIRALAAKALGVGEKSISLDDIQSFIPAGKGRING